MKLIFKNTEVSKIFGNKKYKMEAILELTPEEKQIIHDHGLAGTLLYISEANTENFSQHNKGVGIPGLDGLIKLMTKSKIPKITGSNLMTGLVFEDEFVLSLIEVKQRVIGAAEVFDAAIKSASTFLGEQVLDIPLV